jgi:alpha-tubulin suppressor-like RCC1 family protein
MKIKSLSFISICIILFSGCFPPKGEEQTTVDTTPAAPAPPTTGYTLSTVSVNVPENSGTGTYTIRLNTQPTATVSFAITSDNTSQITVAPDNISFGSGNYSTAQTITLTGVNDDVDDDNVNVNILNAISSSDTDYGALDNTTITGVNVDDDTAAYTASAVNAYDYYENGTTSTWTYRLNTKPTANVTVTMNSTDTGEVNPPSALTFTPSNWSTNQTMTVTGVDDSEIDGLQYITVSTSFSSSDAKYNSFSQQAANAKVHDNRTGKQPNNYIAQGNYFTIAIDDNGSRPVYAWGDDICTGETYGFCDYERISLNTDNTSVVSTEGSGQIIPKRSNNSNLGDNSTTSPIFNGIDNVGIVVAGPSQTAVLHDNRTSVTMWGRQRMRSFGTQRGGYLAGTFTANDIDVGYEHWCIIIADKTAKCGGYGRFGALGDGDRTYSDHGSTVVGLTNIVDLALGNNHSCFLIDNGTVYCTGKNETGQLGSGLDNLSSGCDSAHCSVTPVPITNYNNIVQIDAGTRHTIALLDNGSAVAWGVNDSSQLSIGNTTNQDEPQPTVGLPANVLRVWADNNKSCAASNYYKTLHCSGPYYRGDGSSTSGDFVEVTFPSDFTINHIIKDVSISTGGACAYTLNTLDNSSDLFCWGENSKGTLGLENVLTPYRTPQKVGSPF